VDGVRFASDCDVATWAELCVPPRRLTNAEIAWLAFVTVQALDGMLSYVGVHAFGHGIEANPLVGWYLAAFGPAAAFIGAKLFAVSCGAVLYLTGRHHWVVALTVVYVLVAVGPWIHVLGLPTHI
jgi:hypothetical protein